MNFEDYSVEEKWLYVFTIVDEKQPVGLVNIGGVPIVSMIVDWGASCYVIDRQLWESLKSGVEANHLNLDIHDSCRFCLNDS